MVALTASMWVPIVKHLFLHFINPPIPFFAETSPRCTSPGLQILSIKTLCRESRDFFILVGRFLINRLIKSDLPASIRADIFGQAPNNVFAQ